MTRHVFPNSMVAHVWAQQTQEGGRSHNGNLWFEGDTLYSYRTPIAHITTAPDGSKVLLVSSETYSNTTSQHIPGTAIVPGAVGFRVPWVTLRPEGWCRMLPLRPDRQGYMGWHEANLVHLCDAYRALVADGMNMRKRLRETPWSSLRADLITAFRHARDYAGTFELPLPALDPEGDHAAILAARVAHEAKANDPKKVAARAAARERREAVRAAIAQRQREAAVERNRDVLARWQAGERVWLPYEAQRTPSDGAYLRVMGDTLETSQGASVPLAHAIRVFHFVAECRRRGEGWVRPVRGQLVRVGHFTVDHVAPDGSFKAGCHFIGWPEIERVARIVGVIPPDVPQGGTIAAPQEQQAAE